MVHILTWQDYIGSSDKEHFVAKAINEYVSSDFYQKAIEAEAYFKGENPAILQRRKSIMTKIGKEFVYSHNRTTSNFLFHFVVQMSQYLLINGLQLEDKEQKNKLGFGFDSTLLDMGEMSLVHGVSWGFWNYDHLEMFEATSFFALLDERTSEPKVGIKFWQISPEKPMYVQIFEMDGMAEYIKINDTLTIYQPKRAYLQTIRKDSMSSEIINESNYGVLPIAPLYANKYGRSELTENIKSKIDLYDRIFSDFGDNLERTNDIYWVISNFGGNSDEVEMMLAEIENLRAVFARNDGKNDVTAEPHTIEVPHTARRIALELLEQALYSEFMAMNMKEITGGSLTNVAIETAKFNLSLKVNRFEGQVFRFCQQILKLVGIETENIRFKRQSVANATESVRNVLDIYNAGLFDSQTALEKLDIVEIDEIDIILKRKALEDLGVPADKEDDVDDLGGLD